MDKETRLLEGNLGLAYLGGVFDGDGTVCVMRQPYKWGYYFRLKVAIGNTAKSLVEACFNILQHNGVELPNKAPYYERRTKKLKPFYNLDVTGSDGQLKLLRLISEYVISKRPQVLAAIYFLESRIPKRHPRNSSDGRFLKNPYTDEELRCLIEIQKHSAKYSRRWSVADMYPEIMELPLPTRPEETLKADYWR